MKIVVIPATYNEKGNIEKLITIMENEVFPKIKDHEMFILVADDNSPDGTADAVRELMKKWKNVDVNVGEKKGLGAAYYRAMSYAIEKLGADVVISIDADLQFDPHEIPNYLKKIDSGYDIVTGSRYSEGGSMPENWPLYRKIFSVGANTMVRFITGRLYLHDWTGGFRAYKKEVFLKEREKLKPYSGYTFQVAALYKSLLDNYNVGEVPIHFYSRKVGDSKIAPIEYILNLFIYVITERLREVLTGKFGKFLVVGGFGFIINAVLLRILVESADWNPSAANLAGAVIAIFSNFNFNNLWTFKEHKIVKFSQYLTKLVHFYTTSAFGVIFIQTGTIYLGTYLYGKKYYFVYFLFGTFLLLIWNFFIYNRFIWKNKIPK